MRCRNSPSRSGSVRRRSDAFVGAVEKGGGKCELILGQLDELAAPTTEALRKKNRPTAIFAATDAMALKVYGAAAAAGLKIPDDLSLIGYADFPFSADLVPPLTTVRQDPYLMGRNAARILLDRILERSGTDAAKHVHLAPELIIRASTARAPE